jgi:polyhydroxyalkanoate synthesis regulator phasin
MLETLRRYVDAGRETLTPQKAQDLAQALVKRGEARRDQASALARQLLDWSRRSSERFRETVRREVRRQIARSGVATKDEVEALRRRVRDLERSGPASKTSSSPARKKTAARKKATSRKTTAKKPTARKKTTSARPSAATRPPSGGGSSSG